MAFMRSQVTQLEDVGHDARDMRKVLAEMDAQLARQAQSAEPARTAPGAATSTELQGSWGHPTKGTWTFGGGGIATLVRDSVNGIPARYTITMRWTAEPGNTLVYTPIRNTLVGSPDSDRDEEIANPKTYRAPFQIHNGSVLVLGGASYIRK